MGTLTRKERERRRHRRAVLEAAETVFAEKGFHSATVQEIAERAEFGVGTIYNMFESKNAIYHNLVLMRVREYLGRVEEVIGERTDPREEIGAIIRVKLEFFDHNRRFFRIFSRATVGDSDTLPCTLSDEARTIYREYVQKVRRIFQEGIEEGMFIEADSEVLALSMEGITNYIIARSNHGPGGQPPGASPEMIERILFDGILTERGRQ